MRTRNHGAVGVLLWRAQGLRLLRTTCRSGRQLLGTTDGEEGIVECANSLSHPEPLFRQSTINPSKNRAFLKDGRRKRAAYIAVGSNVGHRIENIEKSCTLLNQSGSTTITDTGLLYETEPMYHTHQGKFINTVILVSTVLQPAELLISLKSIERKLGREKTVANGPRSIDLDILYYDGQTVNERELQIPHPRLLERSFVLWPLRNVAGANKCLPAPHDAVQWSQLPWDEDQMRQSLITPVGSHGHVLRPASAHSKASLMAILNLTPDSFSDGGKHADRDLLSIVSDAGVAATIIDVGGQSTKPGALMITPEEEMSRIVPAIQQIRKHSFLAPNLTISVDTFRTPVARAALEAGAHVVNDISGAQEEPDILDVVAEFGASIILGHVGAGVAAMHDPANVQDFVFEDLVVGWHEAVQSAIRRHVPRWRIWLDPGFGFSKSPAANLRLLRDVSKSANLSMPNKDLLSQLSYMPWVSGFSRKGFIGAATGIGTPCQRQMGNAVALAAAVKNGFDIIRVHDLQEMKQALDMANALWRNPENHTKAS